MRENSIGDGGASGRAYDDGLSPQGFEDMAQNDFFTASRARSVAAKLFAREYFFFFNHLL
jgi:hypothetical protein